MRHELKENLIGFSANITRNGTNIVISIPFSHTQTDNDLASFIRAYTTTKEVKKGYCQRVKDLILEGNPKYKTWEECPTFIIDYPIENTVSVMFPKSIKLIWTSPDTLAKNNVELRLIKPVTNGTIVSYHFND